MHISQRSFVAVVALAFALIAYTVSPQAQQAPAQPGQSAPQTQAPAQPGPSAPQAQAPAQAPAQALATAQGELLEVDTKANTLSIKTPTAEMKFKFDDQTKVAGAQKGVAGLATMTGSQVTIQYKKDGQANLATNIEVKAEQAPRR